MQLKNKLLAFTNVHFLTEDTLLAFLLPHIRIGRNLSSKRR